MIVVLWKLKEKHMLWKEQSTVTNSESLSKIRTRRFPLDLKTWRLLIIDLSMSNFFFRWWGWKPEQGY